MTLAEFRTFHPEFGNVPDAFITAELAASAVEIDATKWNTLFDQGQRYLTAHRIALSPWGTGTRLQAKDGTTTYQKHFDRLCIAVAGGARVI